MAKFINKMKKTVIKEIAKYFFFGIVSTVVNYLMYVIFMGAGLHYVTSNVVSYVVAVVLSYWLNEKFVFEGHRKNRTRKLAEYSMGRAMMLTGDSLLLVFLVEVIGLDVGWAKLPVAAIFLSLNYLINKFWIFK